MILYINSCVRDGSRTDLIAGKVLEKLGGEYEELYLPSENLQPLSKETLEKRTALIEKKQYDDPMFNYAKQFASADKIVISAPYWDLSFPSILKVYIENIYVTGLVSEYTEEGIPHGLCKADELIYVATAGGFFSEDFGYRYIETLAKQCLGIPQTRLVKAEGLDIIGADVEGILGSVVI